MGTQLPLKKGYNPNFRNMSIVTKQLDGSVCHNGTEVSLGSGDIVLDGDPAHPRKNGAEPPPPFRPISIVAKRLDALGYNLVRRYVLAQVTLC